MHEFIGTYLVRIAGLAGVIFYTLEDRVAVPAMFVPGSRLAHAMHAARACSGTTRFSPRVVALWHQLVLPHVSRW
jgi:hypothetical protein